MNQATLRLHRLEELHGTGFDVCVHDLKPILAGSETWWDLLFNEAEVGLVVIDWQGKVVAINRSLATLLDRDQEEMRRLGIAGLTHPDDVKKDAGSFVALMTGALERYEVEKRYVKGDGTLMWGRTQVMALRDERGDTPLAVGVIRDVTSERRAREYGYRLEAEVMIREHAVDLADLVLQGLAVIRWGLERDDYEVVAQSADAAMSAGKDLMDHLMQAAHRSESRVASGPRAPLRSVRLDEDP